MNYFEELNYLDVTAHVEFMDYLDDAEEPEDDF